MHKKDIINLFGIQENLVKKIERDKKSINIWLESKPKLHICPSCNHYTKRIHDYRTQKIQHITIGQVVSVLFLKNVDIFVLTVVKNSMNIMIFYKSIFESPIMFLKMFVMI